MCSLLAFWVCLRICECDSVILEMLMWPKNSQISAVWESVNVHVCDNGKFSIHGCVYKYIITHILMWVCMWVFALTAFWHHTLLHFHHLSPTNGAIRRGHFHHSLPSFHAKPTGGTAYIPFSPFSNQATAWSYTSRNIYSTYDWSTEFCLKIIYVKKLLYLNIKSVLKYKVRIWLAIFLLLFIIYFVYSNNINNMWKQP